MDKLFYREPFLASHSTTVISCVQKDNHYHVTLADTIFYPEGGGQPSDIGYIAGKRVTYVYEQDGEIYHVVNGEVSGKVLCELDWEKRFYHMQHHTGQHLLSAVFQTDHGYSTKGFHLGEEYTTIDIDAHSLDEQLLQDVEGKANKLIQSDLPVKTYIVTNQEMGRLPVRKSIDIQADIRIVQIGDIDYSPCCGTHLSSTGQIGLMKVLKTEKYKQMIRVYFACGKQALADYQVKHATVTALSRRLSVSEGELLDRVVSELENQQALVRENKRLREALLEFRARDIVATAEGPLVDLELTPDQAEETNLLSKQIMSRWNGLLLITVGSRLFVSHSGSQQIHCGNLIKEFAPEFGGRGGGSKSTAQVFFKESAQMVRFKELLKTQVLQLM